MDKLRTGRKELHRRLLAGVLAVVFMFSGLWSVSAFAEEGKADDTNGIPDGTLGSRSVHVVVRPDVPHAAEDQEAQTAAEEAEASQESVRPSLKKAKKAGLAKYDAREESWFEGIEVRNQKNTGLCWAFALTGAAQISYAKQYENFIPLSPVHLGYFHYYRVDDPLEQTPDDRNVILQDIGYENLGGDLWHAMQSMAGWMGLAGDALVPMSRAGDTLSDELAYNNAVTLKNADILESQEEIREAILKYGSAVVEIDNKASAYNKVTYAQYNKSSSSPNHSVLLVGWDDSFSKDSFRSNRQPSLDGAWIVQDSMGKEWRDHGYFYLSYEEILYDPIAIEVQDSSVYDSNYQYDGNASDSSFNMQAGEGAVNFFQVDEDAEGMSLNAVGFTTLSAISSLEDFSKGNDYDDRSFRVCVYRNITRPEEMEEEDPVCETRTVISDPGFHTVILSEPVHLDASDTFAIRVESLDDPVLFGVETEDRFGKSIDFQCGLEEGQSFAYDKDSGAWEDLAEGGDACCARIKGFTVDDSHDISTAALELEYDTTEWTGTEMMPNVTVRFNGRRLVPDRDYAIAYLNNIDAGQATVLVHGIGSFTGQTEGSFEILQEEEEEEAAETEVTDEIDTPAENPRAVSPAATSSRDHTPDTSDSADVLPALLLFINSLLAMIFIFCLRKTV